MGGFCSLYSLLKISPVAGDQLRFMLRRLVTAKTSTKVLFSVTVWAERLGVLHRIVPASAELDDMVNF